METRKMMSGAGVYFQGEDALRETGPELKRRGLKNVFVIGGRKALEAASEKIVRSLTENGIGYEISEFGGFCTAEEVSEYGRMAEKSGCGCILGVGGGKALDVSKAAAEEIGVPVFTAPTCAGTCAAYAPLSVIYDGCGRTVGNVYHKNEVQGVFADTEILAKAPARYLASGIADAFAKSCEYSSMRPGLNYGEADISKYLGYGMALSNDGILLAVGEKAYKDNRNGVVSPELEDAVFCAVASTGVISGMGGFAGRTGSRFAIAHGFNEVIRGRYADTNAWLHGEIVAVGVIAQNYANGTDEDKIGKIRGLFTSMGVPVSLEDMGILLDDSAFGVFTDEIIAHSKVKAEFTDRVIYGVSKIRNR